MTMTMLSPRARCQVWSAVADGGLTNASLNSKGTAVLLLKQVRPSDPPLAHSIHSTRGGFVLIATPPSSSWVVAFVLTKHVYTPTASYRIPHLDSWVHIFSPTLIYFMRIFSSRRRRPGLHVNKHTKQQGYCTQSDKPWQSPEFVSTLSGHRDCANWSSNKKNDVFEPRKASESNAKNCSRNISCEGLEPERLHFVLRLLFSRPTCSRYDDGF